MSDSDFDKESDTGRFWADLPPESDSLKPAHERRGPLLVERDSSPPGSRRDWIAPPARDSLLAGRYRCEHLLGEGGMGQVYLARDEQTGQAVALKVLHGHLARNPRAVKRFQREARIMGELTSPHAVQLHGSGQAEDGSIYLAMEYLVGETLAYYLDKQGRLDPRRVASIGMDVLHVLADAHQRSIIHRDIKPANVFLAARPEGGHPVVKLLDFGVAKFRSLTTPDYTGSGAILGTPKYMSPEQVTADVIDARSDLYSLAMVMYKALTGVHPFEGKNFLELLVGKFEFVPDPPTKRRPDLEIPEALSRVVMRALQNDPEARYATASEMAAELRPLVGEPYC